jgi:hypothetical protein
MADNTPVGLLDFNKKPAFKTEPTQKTPIKSDEAVSFCMDFARARPLVEGYSPLPRPYRTRPSPSTETENTIAIIMPSLEDIEAMTTEQCKAWRDDRSWIDSDES